MWWRVIQWQSHMKSGGQLPTPTLQKTFVFESLSLIFDVYLYLSKYKLHLYKSFEILYFRSEFYWMDSTPEPDNDKRDPCAVILSKACSQSGVGWTAHKAASLIKYCVGSEEQWRGSFVMFPSSHALVIDIIWMTSLNPNFYCSYIYINKGVILMYTSRANLCGLIRHMAKLLCVMGLERASARPLHL